VAVTGFVTGKTESKVKVHLPGGDLVIEVQEDEFVMMSGPANTVFAGVWPD
jgi:diaminopimelate epimerase